MCIPRNVRLGILCVLLGACSADDFDELLGRDGGVLAGEDGGAAESGTARACNAVPLDGALVVATRLERALSFSGGRPAVGTFQLVRVEAGIGALPGAERRTIAITADGLEFASAGAGGEVRWNASFTTDNVDMTVTRTCSGVGAQRWKYTATADGLLIKNELDIVYTYQRR